LHARLRTHHVLRLSVADLPTDYCVLASVLDALALGYLVMVLGDAVAAVATTPGDGERGLVRMRTAGAVIAMSTALN
jgi:nicotinamidase/pyrazinamidase